MTSARCPACGAAVATGAAWCTLCYANLREKPAPTPAVPAPPRPVGGGRHRHAPKHAAASAPAAMPTGSAIAADLLDPTLDRPVMTHADVVQTLATEVPSVPSEAPATTRLAEATWPCFTCGATMPLADATCSQCGSAFLAGASADGSLSVSLPIVGDVRSMSPGMKYVVMAAGAVGVTVVLLVVVAVLGHFV